MSTFLAEIERGDALCSCFSFFIVNKSLCSLLGAMFFAFLCFLLVISLFAVAPKNSAEMVSSVPKCGKAVMCLWKKIRVSEKLHSGMSYSAGDHEFNVYESIIYIKQGVFKQKHTENKVLY